MKSKVNVVGMQPKSLGDPSGFISTVENSYQAGGPREKLAYRKGFEAGVNLIIEYWAKGEPRALALKNSKLIADSLGTTDMTPHIKSLGRKSIGKKRQ